MKTKLYTRVRTRRDLAVCLAALGLGLAACRVAAVDGLKIEPPWRGEGSKARAVFSVGGSGTRIVVLDATAAAAGASEARPVAVHDQEGRPVSWVPLPVRGPCPAVVASCGAGVSACQVYLGPATAAAPLPGPGGEVVESRPLQLSRYAIGGRAVPDEWERLRYLYHRAGAKGRGASSVLEAFGPVAAGGAKGGKQWIVRMESVLAVPETGVYRFALKSPLPAFLLLDNEQAASRSAAAPPDRWQRGAPVMLQRGAHDLEVFSYAGGDGPILAGWQRPGADTIEVLGRGHLVARRRLTALRVERLDSPLHPGFTHEPLRGYRFRTRPYRFFPVRLEAAGADWIGEPTGWRWTFEGGGGADGRAVQHVFVGGGPHRVALRVRNHLGFEADGEGTVDCRGLHVREYALSVTLEHCPFAAYANSVVAPSLVLRGHAPGSVVFDCRWQAARRRADTLSGGMQRACRGFASEALPPLRVGTVREIDWRAVHAGVELFGERVRFLHPPFDALPARASGWSLYDAAGDRLVLVPDRREAGAPQGYDPGGRRRVVCVDDFVAAGGYAPGRDAEAYTSSLAAGLDRASGWRVVYRRLPAPEAGDSEAAGAAEDLVTLAGLEGGADDIVVLSLARRSMEHGDDPETFGLFLAAAADILGRTLNRFLVLVTPPPYTGITTDARAYAAEVHRVAAVRGMPVADLYSAVCGRGRAGSRFLDATGTDLSASGRRLAAELAAEVLRQP